MTRREGKTLIRSFPDPDPEPWQPKVRGSCRCWLWALSSSPQEATLFMPSVSNTPPSPPQLCNGRGSRTLPRATWSVPRLQLLGLIAQADSSTTLNCFQIYQKGHFLFFFFFPFQKLNICRDHTKESRSFCKGHRAQSETWSRGRGLLRGWGKRS